MADRMKGWILVGAICGVAPLVGLVLELVADWFDSADTAFYSTAAQIAPVFALALFVEIALVMSGVFSAQGSTAANQQTLETLVRSNVGLLVLSLGSGLYATGAKDGSSFLVACAVVPWLLQLTLLVDTAYIRVGRNRIRTG